MEDAVNKERKRWKLNIRTKVKLLNISHEASIFTVDAFFYHKKP